MTAADLNQLTLDELVDHRVAWLKTMGSEQALPEESRRLFVPLLRELATGQPLDPQRLAGRARVPLEQTLAYLRETPTEWGPSGERVVGWALTSIPTPHRYQTQGQVLWVWCAVDALMFPVVIGAPATIQSPCAATGDPITIDLTQPVWSGSSRERGRGLLPASHRSRKRPAGCLQPEQLLPLR